VLSGEATNTNFIVFDLTRLGTLTITSLMWLQQQLLMSNILLAVVVCDLHSDVIHLYRLSPVAFCPSAHPNATYYSFRVVFI